MEQQPAKPTTTSDTNTVLIIVVVIVAVALASFGAFWWVLSSSFDRPDIEEDLTLYFNEGVVFTDPQVSVEGTVHNHGEDGCYATVHCTIFDGRGWSISPTIQLGWIGPDGDFVFVEEDYDCPEYYDGQYLDGESIYWTHYVTYTT